MSYCPHCDAELSLTALVKKYRPYSCPKCGAQSTIETKHLRVMGALGFLIFTITANRMFSSLGYLAALPGALAMAAFCVYWLLHVVEYTPMPDPEAGDDNIQHPE